MPSATPPSPLALAVLCLLSGGPLHPYRMQRLLRDWGKDQVINVGQRSSLYRAIARLTRAGLIAARQTERDGQYPERTVYEITDQGSRLVNEWLTDALSSPRNEYPAFPAALSFAMLLGPQRLRAVLIDRATALRTAVGALEGSLAGHAALPRITLIEIEYQLAIARAELGWLKSIVADLEQGVLTWTRESFAGAAEAYDLGTDEASGTAKVAAPITRRENR